MNVRNWKSFYKKEERRSIKENIVDTVSLWSSLGLLWYAVISMTKEKFPNFVEVAILSDTEGVLISGSNYRLMQMEWGFILVWLFILWLASDWPKTYLKKWSILFSLAGILMPIFYIFIHGEKIFTGLMAIVQEYLGYWNRYYSTAFFVASGNVAYAPMAFSVILIVMWWFIWSISYAAKKRILLSLFPIIVLILEMLVGLSPKGAGLFCLFLGTMFLLNIGGTAIVKKAVIVAGVTGGLLICNLCFGERIGLLTTEEKKQEILNWQDSILSMNLVDLFSMDLHFSKEPLGNQTPIYTGEVILEIETNLPPETLIYLKGFYGTTYKNGIWTYDDSAFRELCQTYSYSKAELAEYLFRMPYDAVYHYYDENNDTILESEYVIHYVGSTRDVAYVPYFSQYDSLDEQYTLMGDYLLKKPIWTNSLSVKAVQSNISVGILNQLGDEETVAQETEVLNELSSIYCVNQEQLAFFEQAIQEIKGMEEIVSVDSVGGRNGQKLAFAQGVKNYLAQNMSYSLILDDLPYGADPIEYALMQGHEGYCMHFASAGVLLLRELGVPARYVSGYVVSPSAFVVTENGFQAQVTDYAAHTWVEIYLENVGWVPYEMTPGYSSVNSIPTEEYMDVYEEQSEGEENANLEAERESEANDESEEEEVGQEGSTGDVLLDEEKDKDADSTDSADSVENNFQFDEDILKGGFGLLCFFIIVTGGYLGLRKGFLYYEKSLYSEIKRNLTRRAVKHINKRMYRMLRLNSAKYPGKNLKKGYWTDVKMEEELIASYDFIDKEDWERYMSIVKKMHYSLEDISSEEMQHCYKCYKRVWELTFCKQIGGIIKGK